MIASVAFMPIKAADELIICSNRYVALRVSKMQDQKSTTFRGRSFSAGGSDIVTSIFAHNSGRYIDYGLTLMHSALTVQDE